MTSPDEPSSRVGQTLLGKLQIIRRIGVGGMAEVYEVEHLLTRHRRALKIVRAEIAQERRFVERFMREVSIAGRLNTPFVAETFDAGWLEDDSAYVLMELLPGRSLAALLEDEGMLSERRACSLMCQVAEGIQVAHAAGIVHRDLKPENVFVVTTDDGRERVKILDFGVSKFLDVADEKATKLTREGSVVGTPYYMSPEQAGGRELDGRSDVWAIGVMTYEVLTGRLPFQGETFLEVMLKIGGGTYVPLEHRRPDIDPAVVSAVARALRSNPSDRFPTAEALRRELLPFAAGEPAARAKTISDGVAAPDAPRARGPSLPLPPRLPKDDAPVARAPDPARTQSVRPPGAEASPPAEPAERPLEPEPARPNALERSPTTPSASHAPTLSSAPPTPRWSRALALATAFALTAAAGVYLGRARPSPEPARTVSEADAARATSPYAAADAGAVAPAVLTARTTPVDPAHAAEPPPIVAAEPVPSDATTRRTRPARATRTPAEAAGLEASPYGP